MQFMNRIILFLRLLEDIEFTLQSEDPYRILTISRALRELLLDDYPLAHQVNEIYRLKLYFEVADIRPPSNTSSWSLQDDISPDPFDANQQTLRLSFDDFLAFRVARAESKDFSVRDIVKFGADVLGGVHAGFPRSNEQEILGRFSSMHVGGVPAAIRQLKGISAVVARALSPLRAVIREEHPQFGAGSLLAPNTERAQSALVGGLPALIRNPDFLSKGQPPIVPGHDATFHFQAPAYLDLGMLESFGSTLDAGFTFHIDVVSDLANEQGLLGTGYPGGTSLIVLLNDSRSPGRLLLKVVDDGGRTLSAHVHTSCLSGSRLVLSVEPSRNSVSVFELYPLKDDFSLQVDYLERGSPREFSNFRYPLILGGYAFDGVRVGSFVGRAGHLAICNTALSQKDVKELEVTAREIVQRTMRGQEA